MLGVDFLRSVGVTTDATGRWRASWRIVASAVKPMLLAVCFGLRALDVGCWALISFAQSV
jgi:hypothetical protein